MLLCSLIEGFVHNIASIKAFSERLITALNILLLLAQIFKHLI